MMNDQEILGLFQEKGQEEKAFGLLLDAYQERLYWHIRRIILNHDDADDVLQNTFIKIWRGISSFRSDSGLYTWLYRIATNEALSFLKQRKNKQALHIDDPEQLAMSRISSDPYFDGNMVQKKLFAVIDSLPEKQKLVFQLKYFEEMKYDQISEVLGTSVGALKASYHHAVKKIEMAFKDD